MKFKRLQNVAMSISYITHPMMMPLWATICVVLANPYIFASSNPIAVYWMLASVFINFIAFPALAILLMLRLKLVTTVQMTEGIERVLPFIATGLFYVWGYVVVKNMDGVPIWMSKPLLGACIALFVAFFINIFTKISIHCVGMAGFVTVLILINSVSTYSLLPFICLAVVLMGIVGSARYILHAHTISQIMFGYVIGVLSQVIAFSI